MNFRVPSLWGKSNELCVTLLFEQVSVSPTKRPQKAVPEPNQSFIESSTIACFELPRLRKKYLGGVMFRRQIREPLLMDDWQMFMCSFSRPSWHLVEMCKGYACIAEGLEPPNRTCPTTLVLRSCDFLAGAAKVYSFCYTCASRSCQMRCENAQIL